MNDWDSNYKWKRDRHCGEPPAIEPLPPIEGAITRQEYERSMIASQYELQEMYGNSAVREYAAMYPYSYWRNDGHIYG